MNHVLLKSIACFILLHLTGYLVSHTTPQSNEEAKVILITLDGLRWQELFMGADANLINHPVYASDSAALKKEFWSEDPKVRRELLLPFFWEVISKEGQLYGNRALGNNANLTNNHWFSYPGYSEILCGYADDERINSNSKSNNPNVTVLEYLAGKPGFKNQIAAFTSWDVFPYIINEERSGIPVNSGYEQVENPIGEKEKLINQLQKETPKLWETVRLDAFTHHLAHSYLEREKPRLLFISYGETDDFAHQGKYDQYLYSARRTDQFIQDIWNTVQTDPFYKDQTTIIITTDHGRGTDPDGWKHHGKSSVPRSDEVWMAFLGKNVAAKGEVAEPLQIWTEQIAATISGLLGYDYPVENAGNDLLSILKN
ncbi:alkaline phosphatase family protein [Membranicola marinus]|uniref:Alkaline phosphatase family protein n=1 Tax=Membranihabitans marinus TaxID=1227546 RepID=A0A953L7M2_9BACT|nr:alkaline phosphatase family protein [Membranihabitans marinus]MBY5956760.1 alkaline phosphatase family protein [Membranihabitans marinus]